MTDLGFFSYFKSNYFEKTQILYADTLSFFEVVAFKKVGKKSHEGQEGRKII